MSGLNEQEQEKKEIREGFWLEVGPELLLVQPKSEWICNRLMGAYQAKAKWEQRPSGERQPWSWDG